MTRTWKTTAKTAARNTALLAVSALGLGACASAQWALELYDRGIEFERYETLNEKAGIAPAAVVAAKNGTATYDGQFGFGGEVNDTDNVIFSGFMDLEVDFDANTVKGTGNNLLMAELTDTEIDRLKRNDIRLSTILNMGSQAQGSVTYNGKISGAAINGTANGQAKVSKDTYVLAGPVNGTFHGSQAEGLSLDEAAGFRVSKNGTPFDRSIFEAEVDNR